MSIQTSNRGSIQTAIIRADAGSIEASLSNASRLKTFFSVVEFMVAIEFLIVAACTYAASIIYHHVSFGTLPTPHTYVNESLFVAFVFTVTSLGFRHSALLQKQQLHLLLWSGIGAVGLAFVVLLTTTFLLKTSETYSRGAFILQIIGVSLAICATRALLSFWLKSAIAAGKIEVRRAIVIGSPESCNKAIEPWKAGGIRIMASFPLPLDDENEPYSGDGCQLAHDINVRKISEVCRQALPHEIVILADQKDLRRASDLANYLSKLPCNIHIAPLDDISFITRARIADLGVERTLQVSRRPLSFADRVLKRTFDLIVASVAIVALSPLLLVTAIAIKLESRGSVLFRQMRHGYNNNEIRVVKFRTMTTTEDGYHQFKSATVDDSRVTRVGGILRRTNIDELPQLFNVLSGEMSIVGPRPHATSHNRMFEDKILPLERRHNVKPGITGWAQVNGYRGPAVTVESMRRRIEYDLYYIDNWSFFFDLKIILMTLFSRNAYRNAF